MAGNQIPAHSCSVCLRSVRANTSRQATGFTVNNRSMIGNTFYGECGSQRSLLVHLAVHKVNRRMLVYLAFSKVNA